MTSGIKVKQYGDTRGKIFNNAFGYIVSKSNNIGENTSGVSLFTSTYGNGCGFGINETNFERAVVLLSARKLINTDWINSKDEYLAPDESNLNFEEFVNDSVVFSLFHSASQQSSLRNVEYKNKSWEIKNEFFWTSRKNIMELANENDNEECYEDALTSQDRYVYKYLQNVTLSPEAQAVLDAANELIADSFRFRQNFDADHPDYQINNWDCGYYQLKALWTEYMPEEFREFRLLFNKLADKMRPMVYELGFLKK